MPIRIALTGAMHGPELHDLISALEQRKLPGVVDLCLQAVKK